MEAVNQAVTITPEPPKASVGFRLFKTRLGEYLAFDSRVIKAVVGAGGVVVGLMLFFCRQTRRGFELLARVHRANYFRWAEAAAVVLARSAARRKPGHRLVKVYDNYVERLAPQVVTEKYFDRPSLMFPFFAMVLKSPRVNEKGVLVLEYNYIFPAFARLFDVAKVASRYYLVLEPTWSGFCTLEVLAYSRYDFPVFVQAHEPRDAAFIDGLKSNLVSVPTSTNWWVDHNLFRPLEGVEKDIDVVMIAAWAKYKRHHRFFAALRKLRQSGHRLRVLLVGYGIDKKKADILDEARHFEIEDQLEVLEKVPYDRVNEQLNRAKVNLLWSRKEGVNRAIIEGMFAGVPCLVRDGFNYGHKYAYINDQTGGYATERGLPDALLRMVERYQEYSPREWVMANMSCEKATEILAERIRDRAVRDGEPWTTGLAVKTNELNGMCYWDPADARRFETDYEFLRSAVREPKPPADGN